MEKFNRSIPYLKALHKSPRRKSYLNKCPQFVLDDICEILYNVLKGNIDIEEKHANSIAKIKKKLTHFMRKRKHKSRTKYIENQNGGFLGIAIPLIANAIGALL